jgi:hypothetical protein
MPVPQSIDENQIIKWVVGTSQTASMIEGIWSSNPKADDTAQTPIVVAQAPALPLKKAQRTKHIAQSSMSVLEVEVEIEHGRDLAMAHAMVG